MESILHFDEWLFSLLNGTWRADFLDAIAPMWRHKYFWLPLYLFILAIVGINFRSRLLPFLLFAVLTITVADTVSSKVIKPLVKRDRPCRAAHLAEPAVVLVSCGGGYSFTSSHATNHFAIACFFILTIGGIFTYSKSLFLLWAASISYGQVYVGVHYPVDIICGAIIGSLIGIGVAYVYNTRWRFTSENFDPIA